MPRLGAASMVRRTASAPARCPALRTRPRLVAQRPLPSMMMATCRPHCKALYEVLCAIKYNLQKKDKLLSLAGGANQSFHVVQVSFQRPAARRGQAVVGLGKALVKIFAARNVAGLF